MMYRLIFLIMLIGCTSNHDIIYQNNTPDTDTENDNVVIAFGSCSRQDKAQPLWDDILAEKPDVWIWLGDNIYGDTEDMSVMRTKYNKQKSNLVYQQILKETEVIGTWDDHDYGINDGGKYYAAKENSQVEFLDFLDVSQDDVRRTRPGIYTSYDVATEIAKIRIFLLDVRYFRDDLFKKDGVCMPMPDSTILGEAQWAWLKSELATSDADIHIFASGIQVIPKDHRFEKWANFPTDRERLLNLIETYNIKKPIFITGDRHIGEISKLTFKSKVLYDITSSSLTHGWTVRRAEQNQHRIGEIVYDLNYGVIEIARDQSIKAFIKGDNGEVKEEIILSY